MKLLLDTHALLWWSFGEAALSPKVQSIIESGDSEIYVSTASIWEIAIKLRLEKLSLPLALTEFIARLESKTRARLLPVGAQHAAATLELPPLHRDPFDRMLVAQCLVDGLHLATADDVLSKYPVRIVW